MKTFLMATTIAVAALSGAMTDTAQAAPIVGSASGGGFFSSIPTPPPNTIAVVSAMAPGVIPQGTAGYGSGSGDFTGAGAPSSVASFDTTAPGGVIYTFTAAGVLFTFTLESVTNIVATPLSIDANGNGSDALTMQLHGTVSAPGFDDTIFLGIWTAQGSCAGTTPPPECSSGTSASWSVSLTAQGEPSLVPEPASLAVLGFGLLGLGLVTRRRTH